MVGMGLAFTNVIEYVGPRIADCEISTPVEALALEHAEEALGQGVVCAVADVAHAQRDKDRKSKRPHGLNGKVGRGIRPDKEGVAEGQAAPIPLRTCRDGRARRGERGPRGDHGQTGRPDAWMGVWRRTGGFAGAPGR